MADLPVRVSLHDLLCQISIIHPDLATSSTVYRKPMASRLVARKYLIDNYTNRFLSTAQVVTRQKAAPQGLDTWSQFTH